MCPNKTELTAFTLCFFFPVDSFDNQRGGPEQTPLLPELCKDLETWDQEKSLMPVHLPGESRQILVSLFWFLDLPILS